MKPLLSLDKDGYVTALERVRGKGKVLPRVLEIVGERVPSRKASVVTISHSDASEEALKLKEGVLSLLKVGRVYESQIGSIIGTHVGPGCLAVQVFPE